MSTMMRRRRRFNLGLGLGRGSVVSFGLVGSVTRSGTSGGTSAVPAKPTGVAEGDLLLACVARANVSADPISIPEGFTLITKQQDSVGPSYFWWIYYKITGADEPSTYTWSWAASAKIEAQLAAYRGGFDTSDPVDGYSNAHYEENNTTVRAGSVTVSSVDSPLVFFGSAYRSSGSVTFSPPADYVEDSDIGASAPDFYMEFAHRVWGSSGATGNVDGTLSTSLGAGKQGFLVALNPSE